MIFFWGDCWISILIGCWWWVRVFLDWVNVLGVCVVLVGFGFWNVICVFLINGVCGYWDCLIDWLGWVCLCGFVGRILNWLGCGIYIWLFKGFLLRLVGVWLGFVIGFGNSFCFVGYCVRRWYCCCWECCLLGCLLYLCLVCNSDVYCFVEIGWIVIGFCLLLVLIRFMVCSWFCVVIC